MSYQNAGKEKLLTTDAAGARLGGTGVAAAGAAGAANESDDEMEAQEVKSAQDAMREKAAMLAKKSFWVMIFFGIVAFVALLALILGLSGAADFSGFFYVILIANMFGCGFGAVGTYLWGTISDQINVFHSENQKFESSIQVLELEKNKLHTEVEEIDAINSKMQSDIDGLNTQLAQFDDLKSDLERLAGESEDLNQMLDSVSGVFRDTKRSILYNEKARLLSVYYRAAFQDGADGLTEDEWNDMLMDLGSKQRRLLEQTSFKDIAGVDNIIDLQEFQDLIDRVLAEVESELVSEGYE